MNKQPLSRRWINFTIIALLFLTPIFLQGCDGLMSVNESESEVSLATQNKFRHADMMSMTTRRVGGAYKNDNSVGLIFAIEPQKIFDRYKILDRYKIFDRYKILDRYEYEHAFNGFAIWADADEVMNLIAEMERDSDILWVEPDIYVGRVLLPLATETGSGSQLIPWGTQRIGASGYTANGVDLFVIDTGVSHADVNVTEAIDFREDSNGAADYDGHGTHIAGLAAAVNDADGLVGVAPGVNVRSLKVLNGDETSESDQVEMAAVIAAVEYVTGQKLANPARPMVVNMSLGADIGSNQYNALDEAVAASIANGVTYVISAGNQGIDARNVTPAHVEEAITVGAYDLFDRFAPFSNYGTGVDILAPGTDLISLLPSTDASGYNYVKMSGTSMAAGYISGAVALFIAKNPTASPAQVQDAITTSGQAIINNTPSTTTSKTIDVHAMMGWQVPPFFQYTVTSHSNIYFKDGNVTIGIEPGGNPHKNTNIFTNGSIVHDSNGNRVEGFGYFVANMNGSQGLFQPRYNPTGEALYQREARIDIPRFYPNRFQSAATRSSSDVYLSGNVELGTRENPVIWYVSGNIKTSGPTRISGYGVFIVKGNIEIEHKLTMSETSSEHSTLGLYANGNIYFKKSNITVMAQLFANGKVSMESDVTLYGTITTGGATEFKDNVTIYHRDVAPELVKPFWE